MARKVFISFLGSNNYLETYYSLEDEKSKRPVRFIQEDLVKRLCNEWTKDDRILIFVQMILKQRIGSMTDTVMKNLKGWNID